MKRLVIVLCLSFFVVMPVYAGTTVDKRCFSKEQCTKDNGDFEKRDDVCAGAMGFCYAKSIPVNLSVPIGNVGTITGLANYFQVAYRYMVGVGIVIAVLMGSIAGIRWMTAAGVPARITSAKQLLTQASLGLVLLLFSYLILFTINPDILEFKVLRVAMTRKEAFSENTSCQFFGDAVKLSADSGKPYEELKPADFKHLIGAKSPACGKKHYIEDSGGVSCMGYHCAKHGYVCYKDKCVQAILAGTIESVVNNGKSIAPPVIDDEIALQALCGDGAFDTVKKVKVSKIAVDSNKSQSGKKFDYIFGGIEWADLQKKNLCSSHYGVRGYFIEAEVNDVTLSFGEKTLIGGVDDWHGIGRNIDAARKDKCVLDVNLCKVTPYSGSDSCTVAKQEFNDPGSDSGVAKVRSNDVTCESTNCGIKFTPEDYKNTTLNPGTNGPCSTSLCMYLIPEAWLFSKTCNIRIDRALFPDLTG